jgi:phenylalanine-4-hydroxylase
VRTTLFIQVPDSPGALKDALQVLEEKKLNLTRIDSRPSSRPNSYDFFVDIDFENNQLKNSSGLSAAIEALKKKCQGVNLVGNFEVPNFPRKMSDLDGFASRILGAGAELESDHPGFIDPAYRQRRQMIAKIALSHKHGNPIPRIDYTKDEIATWAVVYKRLTSLFPKYACREHNYVFPLLIQNCGYSENNIPQLEDISNFLKDCTGFILRPVTGLLSSRDFLNGLAFRVFHSTQYIRHHSKPLYTPEPDICHELLGHVPLFADKNFADFSQTIGLASIGASDEDIEKLATCYWFTVEFGLCRQNGERKAFGAGLLSSFGELEYAMSDKPIVKRFDPRVACTQKYPITTFQPIYFEADSFADAKVQMENFGDSLNRPFAVYYNPYLQKIETLRTSSDVLKVAQDIEKESRIIVRALKSNLRSSMGSEE